MSSGATTFVDLHTRGELKLNAHKGKVAQEVRADDAVYRRGAAKRAAVRGQAAPSAPPASAPQTPDSIQRTGYAAPADSAGAVVPAAVTPTQGAPPPAATLLPPLPPAPPAGGTATPGPVSPAPGGAIPGATPPGNVRPGPLAATPPGSPPPLRQYSIVPRNPAGFKIRREAVGPSLPGQPPELATIVTGGFILTIRSVDARTGAVDLLDLEADRGVIWTRGETGTSAERIASPEGVTGREMEFYLAGNVELRQHSGKEERTLRAEEMYYDVSRNIALALTADLEWRQPGVPDMIHFQADELQQLGPAQFRGVRGTFFSSKLPSDPGLKVLFAQATLEERRRFRRTVFGREIINLQTDQPVVEIEKQVDAQDVFLRIEDVPVFWLPYFHGDANDPLGPIRDISAGYNNIYGAELHVGWNIYDLLGIDRIPMTTWHMDTDYLSLRGPALGTEFDFAGKDPFGVPSHYSGLIKAWIINDTGNDILGGTRSDQPHPDFRDRLQLTTQIQDLPYGFSGQLQVIHDSDQNVVEQYDKINFDQGLNRETFLYGKQQPAGENYAWTFLAEDAYRDWFTETSWLPKADGYLIGQSFFDLLSYDVHADAGYAQFKPATIGPSPLFSGPPPIASNAVAVDTGRFDVQQELRLPFYAGPVKVVPYATLDLSYYTNDLEGQDKGRAVGGGGVMASIPFTRLYPDVHSLLWNLDGINHKIVLSGNYYNAGSSASHTLFPELDRLNDDADDYSLRWMTPYQQLFNPNNAQALMNSPVYNTQLYALRDLVMNRIDTLDTIQELQLDVRQRWQTKRGFPGQEHIIDWMTLDLSATVFPAPNRDNFGSTLGFVQYDWNWNIGDRTALTSSGFWDPETDGPRIWTIGAYLNRNDRTSLFLGYRQIDPLESKAVTAALTYVFSPKYSITASSTYDFGTSEALSNAITLTRIGSDVTLSVGLTYNALTSSVGATLQIVPNLIGNKPTPGFGPGLLQR